MSRRNFSPIEESSPRSSRRGMPWGKLFLLGLLGIIALAWFAPTIVMKTGLRDTLLKTALKDFPGTVAVTSASAGWLSSVEVRGASAFDAQGQEVLTIASARTQKTLFSLLMDQQELGVIRIEQPKLNLVLRADGSNLEDLLKPWLQAETSSTPIGCGIEIVDGSIEVTSVDGGAPWRLDQFHSTVNVPRDRTASWSAQMKSGIATAKAPPGSVALDLHWEPSESQSVEPSIGQGAATIQAKGLPLEVLAVALRRAGTDLQLAGLFTTDASVAFSDKSQTVKVTEFAAQNLFVASPSQWGPDQVQLSSVAGSGEVWRGNGEWQFRKVTLTSDVAAVEASGGGPADHAKSIGSELANAFRRGNWEIRGNADVAKLSAMLPNMLRLREGTHVSSGQLTVVLTSNVKPEGNSWDAELQANQLAAIHAGTSFEWKKPILVKAAVTESTNGILINQLTCESSFLQLSGKGTLQQGQFAVNGDLSQFVNEVGRFVDLGTLRAGGNFNGQLDWQSTDGQVLSVTGKGSAREFELTATADRPWREKQLDLAFQAAAKVTEGRVAQIDRGTLNVTSAGDQLDVQLLQPVADPSASATWPCHVHLQGNLGRWLARLQMFFTLDPWRLDAEAVDVEGDIQASTRHMEFANTKGTAKDFQFVGAGLTVREPTLQIETTGSYDMASGGFTSPRTVISSSTIALSATNVRSQFAGGQLAGDGDVQYRTNLQRLASWVRDPSQPETYRVQGEATGTTHLKYAQGATQVDATASIDKFSYATPAAKGTSISVTPVSQASSWQELWAEPRLELVLQGALDANGQLATIEKLEVAGDSLSLGAAGSIKQPLTRCDLDLSGQYAYDLERLSQRLRGMLGPEVQVSGTGQRPFTFKGPLFAAATQPTVQPISTKAESASLASLHELLVEASLGWQKISVQGFEIGQGEVTTKLNQGQLTISPINLPVSEGKISIAPRVDVTRTPYVATLEPGTIVDQVRISPQMCRSWLKYLAPLMADATAAEGHFSVSVDQARFPVTDPIGGNIEGKFIVHSAQIGPGPLSQEILSLVQTLRAAIDKQPLTGAPPTTGQWLDVPEQKLNFQLADHRVYHRDMQFMAKEVSVRTSGWVGLDQTIALVADIPVRDEWVAKDRYLASLKGQTIRLPINGTLSRPQVDRTAIRELTKQTVINAGTNLLQQEVGRGLNRLFQPKAPATPPPTTPVP